MTAVAKERAVVLLSGGLDSTVNIYAAKKEADVVLALTFDYGQRAAAREIASAKKTCDALGVLHHVVYLPWFADFTRTSLLNRRELVPTQEVRLDDQSASESSMKRVWVPNRNGIFLNIAAAFAEGVGARWVVPGFNAEEAATFSDNSSEFLAASTSALRYSTSNKVEVKCFTVNMRKPELVRYGRELGVRFDWAWPCYLGDERPCGKCESCQRFARAMSEAGMTWPW